MKGEGVEEGEREEEEVEGEAAEEPGRVEGASVAGSDTRRSEKAKVSEEALLTGGSEAERPLNVREHTYTQSRTPNIAYVIPRVTHLRSQQQASVLGSQVIMSMRWSHATTRPIAGACTKV